MWGNPNSERAPVFIPKPKLSLVPIVVAAGKVVTIDNAGVKNDGSLVVGSPTIAQFMAIEWTVGSDLTAQSYMNTDTTKLGPPVTTQIDGIDVKVTAYNIKNTSSGNITLYVRGM